MSKVWDSIKRFAADEQGTALMEYTILLGILVIAVITIISTLGSWIVSRWQALCNGLTSCGGGTGGGPGGA